MNSKVRIPSAPNYPARVHEKGPATTDSLRKSRTLRLLRDPAIRLVLTVQLMVIVPVIFPDGRAKAAGSNATARVAVNVRSGPGTDHSRIDVLYPDESPSIRDSAVNSWVPITWRGRNVWVASAYVIGWDVGEKGSSTGEKGFAWTRVKLNARSPPSFDAGAWKLLDKGTRVSLTGQVPGQQSQTGLNGDMVWVTTRYLDSLTPEQAVPTLDSTSVSTTSAPEAIDSRWGNAEFNLWIAARGNRFVEVTPKGTEFRITGTVSDGRAQVVWKGAVCWVTARHLIDSAPTESSASSGGEAYLTSLYSDDSAIAPGKPLNQQAIRTVHKALPLDTRLRVTNPANGRTVEVTVNDHDSCVTSRYLDLTVGVFRAVADTRQGVARASYGVIG